MNPWLTVSRSSKRVVTRKVNNLYKDHNSSLLIFKGGVEIYMLLSYNTYCLIKIKFFIYYPKDYIKIFLVEIPHVDKYEEESRAYLKTENVYYLSTIKLLKLFIPSM